MTFDDTIADMIHGKIPFNMKQLVNCIVWRQITREIIGEEPPIEDEKPEEGELVR